RIAGQHPRSGSGRVDDLGLLAVKIERQLQDRIALTHRPVRGIRIIEEARRENILRASRSQNRHGNRYLQDGATRDTAAAHVTYVPETSPAYGIMLRVMDGGESANDGWAPWIEALAQRRAFARSMGGSERLARQHAAGRLDARERIRRLCDEGSFRELW